MDLVLGMTAGCLHPSTLLLLHIPFSKNFVMLGDIITYWLGYVRKSEESISDL